ncbi:MAG TPA: hypothetical protein VFY50_02265, partial [Candidatus Nitrosocosmicus sp.]|nr:hypothetical protein [Candidatus Nitrosocosmicus sp.]
MYDNLSEDGIQRFHHKSCYPFYNRLVSIYGDDFSHLELNRIKWGSGSKIGDLLELSLYDIKNSKYLQSEVVSDLNSFNDQFLTEFERTKSTIDILFSSSWIFKKFGKLLEAAIFSLTKNQATFPEMRILLVREKAALKFVDKVRVNKIAKLNVNYVNDNKNNYFLALFDRS